MNRTRRSIVRLAAASSMLAAERALSSVLPTTPDATPGPFYPTQIPVDADADLLHVDGMKRIASGIPSQLTGRVLSPNGCAITQAKVEIWQCDAFGAYHHPRDRGDIAEPEFQGYGFTSTGNDGSYRFITIRPQSYPGRTPHIHVRVVAPGMPSLTTQLYVKGVTDNQRDFLFNRIPEDKRDMMMAEFPQSAAQSESVIARFDIVLGTTVSC